MKFLISISLILLLSTSNLMAQDNRTRGKRSKNDYKVCTLIGFGGNYGVFAPTGFNDVLREFNEKYAATDGQFPLLAATQGGSLLVTSYGNHGESKARMWYEFGLRGNFKTLQATEKVSQLTNKMEQQFYTAHFGLGAMPVLSHGFDLALAASFDGGMLMTNAKGTNFTKTYNHAQTDLYYGFSVFMPMYFYFSEHVSLGIRPYYQYQLNDTSFKDLRLAMNTNPLLPNPAIDADKTVSKFSNYGVYVHLNIVFQKSVDINQKR